MVEDSLRRDIVGVAGAAILADHHVIAVQQAGFGKLFEVLAEKRPFLFAKADRAKPRGKSRALHICHRSCTGAWCVTHPRLTRLSCRRARDHHQITLGRISLVKFKAAHEPAAAKAHRHNAMLLEDLTKIPPGPAAPRDRKSVV